MIDEEMIRERAYTLWEQKGRPEGPAEDFWHEARQQLEAENSFSEGATALTEGIESPSVAPIPKSQE